MPSPRPLRQAILILTDTQRLDMLGCYGGQEVHTPNLDRLAREGLKFDRAYCVAPICGPARSALFTGQYPHANGSWSNSQPLAQTVLTLGQRLQRVGIEAGYIGKWHLDGHDYFGGGAPADGWDAKTWYDMRCYLEELTLEERERVRRPETNREAPVAAEMTFAHRCTERAAAFLRAHSDQDFLLVVSYDEPHHPWITPAEYFDRADQEPFFRNPSRADTLAGKPEHQRIWAEKARGFTEADEREALRQVLASNIFVDHEIGRLLAAAEASSPGALLIYTSDHGDLFGGHQLQGKGPAMYEEITHIPLLARWPGHIAPGTTCPAAVSHISLTPTFLDFFGVPLHPVLEGGSLLPALRDPVRTPAGPVFMEFGRFEVDHDGFGGFEPIRAACDGRYKLVVNLLDTDEFYDLAEDPHEMRNRIDDPDPACAAARDRLHDAVIAWMDRTRDPFRGHRWVRRPWRHDAPEATWDNSGMTRQRAVEAHELPQLDYSTGLPPLELTRRKRTAIDPSKT
jgi:uncharacterized sulfatase